jgi:hypothetical protein
LLRKEDEPVAAYTFAKDDMSLRIQVTEGEPFFQVIDVLNSVGMAKTLIEDYLPKDRWVNFTGLIGAIDAVEHGGKGYNRKRVNPIYRARVDRFRNWLEWEVIPQLSTMVVG